MNSYAVRSMQLHEVGVHLGFRALTCMECKDEVHQ